MRLVSLVKNFNDCAGYWIVQDSLEENGYLAKDICCTVSTTSKIKISKSKVGSPKSLERRGERRGYKIQKIQRQKFQVPVNFRKNLYDFFKHRFSI
jgi:hypothetical protein